MTNNESICLDARFSTTRLLFRDSASSDTASDVKTENSPKRATEGGLRTKGLSKRGTSREPLISVISVVYNGVHHIENTIRSVIKQDYGNIEYIIIDGGSTDGTLDIIRKYSDAIDYWVSEPDRGIYDAMNKGLSAAHGEWLNFMNAGDAFFSKQSIACIVKEFSQALVYYSDTVFYFVEGELCYYRTVPCDASKYQFIHQSCVYNKRLHGTYGKYVVAEGVTVSDYLLFKAVPHNLWHKTDVIVAKYYVGNNVSSGRRHREQVYGVDLLFGTSTIHRTIANYCLQKIRDCYHWVEESIFGNSRRVDKYRRLAPKEFWRDFSDDDQNNEAPDKASSNK